MRGRGTLAAFGCAALAASLSGCNDGAPEIPAAQVEEWNTEAAAQFPDLTVDIRAFSNADMFGGGTNSVSMVIQFDDFGDLKASEAALASFEEQIMTEAGVDHVSVEAVSADDAEAYAALQADAEAAFTDVVKAEASLAYVRIDGSWQASVRVELFVESADVIDPDWLTAAADIADQVARANGGTVRGLSLAEASELDRIAENPNLQVNHIPPSTIDAVSKASEGDCLAAGGWAFDISSSFIDVYPADAPGGACA